LRIASKSFFFSSPHFLDGGFNSEVHNSTCIEKEISCL
jgi:hypothetical protein